MAKRLPIFDNHIHLRPEFLGVEGAKLFEKAGGTVEILPRPKTLVEKVKAAKAARAAEKAGKAGKA